MIHIDKSDITRISRELDAFYTSVKCFCYFSGIRQQNTTDGDGAEFRDFIEFTLLHTLLANWTEVFGIGEKNNHWKEITLENPEFIDRLYRAGEFDYKSWTEYRNYVNDLSHDFILFPDPYHHKDQQYDLKGIEASLEITHQWLNELVSSNKNLVASEEIKKWPVEEKNHTDTLKLAVQDIFGVSG